MKSLVIIGLGGALGSIVRYLVQVDDGIGDRFGSSSGGCAGDDRPARGAKYIS